MFIKGSSFTVLYTTSVEKTHDFYQKLGMEIKQLESDKVVVVIGGFELHFILNTEEPFAEYRYIAEPGRYGQGAIFYIEAEDIEKVEERVKNAGGTVKAPLFNNHWGCREVLFEDPNGYKFAAYQ